MLIAKIFLLLYKHMRPLSTHEIAEIIHEDEFKVTFVIDSLLEKGILKLNISSISDSTECSCYYSVR